jgi:hypothetical protein
VGFLEEINADSCRAVESCAGGQPDIDKESAEWICLHFAKLYSALINAAAGAEAVAYNDICRSFLKNTEASIETALKVLVVVV